MGLKASILRDRFPGKASSKASNISSLRASTQKSSLINRKNSAAIASALDQKICFKELDAALENALAVAASQKRKRLEGEQNERCVPGKSLIKINPPK